MYRDGGCSWSPDTGPFFDFQLPCKAHDYCYDLRKAGFSGTVSDDQCDLWFYWLMEAHCNNRLLAGDCRIIRDTYYLAVAAPGVVTDPDPAPISLKVQHSLQCADVAGSSQADNATIVQYPCTGTQNQKFRLVPAPGAAGYFLIKPAHSGKCADVNAGTAGLTQWGCGAFSEQRFTIQGVGTNNVYTIRSQLHNGGWCWDVPASSTATVQLTEYTCYQTLNQRWILS